MNNNMTVRNKKTTFIILIVSWVLAITLIVLGIVSCSSKKHVLTLDSSYSMSVEQYEDYTFEFTPSSSRYYELSMDGGYLSEVSSETSSSVSYSSISTYAWDYAYKVYLSAGTTYYFEIWAEDDFLNVRISNY